MDLVYTTRCFGTLFHDGIDRYMAMMAALVDLKFSL